MEWNDWGLVRRFYDCPEVYRRNETATKPVCRGNQQEKVASIRAW